MVMSIVRCLMMRLLWCPVGRCSVRYRIWTLPAQGTRTCDGAVAIPVGWVALFVLSVLERPVPETTCDFYPNNPNNPSKETIIRPKTAESHG